MIYLNLLMKMLELGVCAEKEKLCEQVDNRDDEFTDISFEELLAQEKKDSFWLVLYPLFFIKLVNLWKPHLPYFGFGGEGLICNSPITTFSVFVQAKKWEIKSVLKLIYKSTTNC